MLLVNILKNKLNRIISSYLASATLVEGILKGSLQPLRCLFVDNSDFMSYFSAKVFLQQPRILKKWKILLPTLIRIIKDRNNNIDLCVAELPFGYEAYFQGLYDFKTQGWVYQILDIQASWQNIKNALHRNPKKTGRKIIRYGLTYKISNDINDFIHFYHHMFVPLVDKQHGNLAYIDTYDEMLPFFLKGFLLMVMDGDHAIAGGLCIQENNTLIFRRMGVLNADDEYIKKGAQSAIYYFIIAFAKGNDLRMVDFMWSKPFLADSIYKHKREWGAAVYPSSESESWVYFFILRHSGKIVELFESNPTIIHTPDGLSGLAGWHGSPALTPEDVRDLTSTYYSPGLEKLLLLTPDPDVVIKMPFGPRQKEYLTHE